MKEIYYLLLVVLTAVGSSFITLHVDKVKHVIKRLFTRRKRQETYVWGKHELSLPQILELIERRLDLLDKQNKSFHDRMDDLDEQIDNLATTLAQREERRDAKVKSTVNNYLKQLQK